MELRWNLIKSIDAAGRGSLEWGSRPVLLLCTETGEYQEFQYMKRRKVWIAVLIVVIGLIDILGLNYLSVVNTAKARFAVYQEKARILQTAQGKVSYIDEGTGAPVLVCHGICGGYDQGVDVLKDKTDSCRVIAPSRFGYPGSDLPENASVDLQVETYVELLDTLGIEKAYVLGTSAGGTVAIRMAIAHPERCMGLILYCSGYPDKQASEKKPGISGPPAFVCNDFCMWLASPFFEPLMGMDGDTIRTILPIADRKEGILFDSRVVNGATAGHFEDYNLEKAQVPVLIIHAKDDKLASFASAEAWSRRIPDCTFLPIPDGGHTMRGHAAEISEAVDLFIKAE